MDVINVENEPKTDTTRTDNKRRMIVKAGLSAGPVIATLTSKPVQAVQGLSNMLSGDASVCRGDNRYGGQSPGFWKALTGKTDPVVYLTSTISHKAEEAWSLTGYEYGTLVRGENPNKYESYVGGTVYSDVFGSNIPDSGRTLREVLNQDEGSDQFHLIAGLLNARYFDAISPAGQTMYIFTTQQFWDMHDHLLNVPDSFNSLRDLIETYYHSTPGGDCI